MTSIMTNTAAMTALQTLQSTNNMLESTQNRISTGYRVSEASDNAAYWSIATTMRSDNKSMSAVKDSLGMGAATVDTAYTGMTAIQDVLDEIKAKLTTATGENIDKAKVQSEITQLQEQLTSIADSASFSGENWLSVSESGMKGIVSSFARDSSGALSLGSIQVNTATTAVFNSSADESGLLEASSATSVTAIDTAFTAAVTAGTAAAGTAGPTAGTFTTGTYAATQAFTLENNDFISFDVTIDGGDAQTFTISRDTVNQALGTDDGVVDSAASYGKVLELALADIEGATVTNTAGVIEIESATTGTTSTVAVANVVASSVGVDDIDISSATTAQIQTYIKAVDSMSESVISAAADLGAVKTRVDMQTEFVGNLMNAIDRGVGTLVDADMTEESTMLKALQTQQQLGVQALSIANTSSQTLLSLFR